MVKQGLMVGVRGFEPPASASRTQRSTGLSHTPTCMLITPEFCVFFNWPSEFTTFSKVVESKFSGRGDDLRGNVAAYRVTRGGHCRVRRAVQPFGLDVV